MDQPLELYKLKPIDRKVFFWLLSNASISTVSAWIECTAAEYSRKRIATIDPVKFLFEAYDTCHPSGKIPRATD